MSKFKASKRSFIKSTAQTLTVAATKLEAQGKKIHRLHVGQPSTSAPQGAIDAVIKAEQDKVLGYTSSVGLTALRERIATHYHEEYGVNISPDQVVVTIGASLAVALACISCFEQGATIGVPYPVYAAYLPVFKQFGLNIVGFSTSLENNFQPTPADLDALDTKIDGIIQASPSNPAGSILTADKLKELAIYCEQKGIRLISDEIYHGIYYDESCKPETALKFSNECIVVNSFSKYYSMPGWRIGWLVAPEYIASNLATVIRNLYISPPTPSQYAALAAMDCREELNQHIKRYKKNRDVFLSELPKAGFDKFIAPQGAFYFYAHVQHLHHDSHKFCMEILNETGICSMPGTDFDPIHGHRYIRFSYAGSTEDIEEAMHKLITWRNHS